jgi:hypothetical protein
MEMDKIANVISTIFIAQSNAPRNPIAQLSARIVALLEN